MKTSRRINSSSSSIINCVEELSPFGFFQLLRVTSTKKYRLSTWGTQWMSYYQQKRCLLQKMKSNYIFIYYKLLCNGFDEKSLVLHFFNIFSELFCVYNFNFLIQFYFKFFVLAWDNFNGLEMLLGNKTHKQYSRIIDRTI